MLFWPPLPSQVPLQNKYDALELEGQANDSGDAGLSGELTKTSQSTRWITTTGAKKERKVIVVGNSIMRGTEGSVSQLDLSHREIFCFPGAQVRESLDKFSPLIITHCWLSGLATRTLMRQVLGESKRTSRHWGDRFKGWEHR